MAAALLNASVPSCGAPAPYYACAAALQNARPVSRFSDREAKKAAKAARVARAGAPGHLAKKAALIESINKGRPARDVVEAEKKEAVRQLKDALRERMRREMLSEMPPCTNRRTKKQRSRGGGSVIAELRDLPDMTLAEARKEREDCFARAWAQKRAREAVRARGEIFVSEWQRAAAAKPPQPKRKAKQPPSSDSD